MIASIASGEVMPVNGPELTSRSSPECADEGLVLRAPRSSTGSTTRRISRPNFRANSKSRSSWAGTAMIAPVP